LQQIAPHRRRFISIWQFPAGLVIYWAWNNTLSVTQQSIIMRRHGAKIELFDNIKAVFGGKKKGA
jgi:YidC/Oxa1 family membrane protein insertase